MKYYVVPLYEVNFSKEKTGHLDYIDTIIVKKKFFGGVQEMITKFPISILPEYEVFFCNGDFYSCPTSIDWNYYLEYGHQILVKEDSLNKGYPIFDSYSLDSYIDLYEKSAWKKIYTEMKTNSENRRYDISLIKSVNRKNK